MVSEAKAVVREHQEWLAIAEPTDPRAAKVLLVRLVHPVHLERTALLECQEHPVINLEVQCRALRDQQDLLASLECRVCLEPLADLANLEGTQTTALAQNVVALAPELDARRKPKWVEFSEKNKDCFASLVLLQIMLSTTICLVHHLLFSGDTILKRPHAVYMQKSSYLNALDIAAVCLAQSNVELTSHLDSFVLV